jgi:hypothetical protein
MNDFIIKHKNQLIVAVVPLMMNGLLLSGVIVNLALSQQNTPYVIMVKGNKKHEAQKLYQVTNHQEHKRFYCRNFHATRLDIIAV